MIKIDGSQGEGGGQIFRTSLSLAMCLQKPVTVVNIRAGRRKSGLLRQHLTCLRAAQKITGATVEGDELGSGRVVFQPGPIKSGRYHFAIGTAGSTTLLFQTLLPALLLADAESELQLDGGTHNGMAPSFDFIEQCFFPVLNQMGVCVDVQLQRYGFYPAGGGTWRARICPLVKARPLQLVDVDEVEACTAVATSAQIPAHVTERELSYVQRKDAQRPWQTQQRLVESYGPGNIVSLRLQRPQLTEVVERVGQVGLSAERVAGQAIKEAKQYLNANVAVGEHLADQLLLPMLLGAGGEFSTLAPSLHTQTHIDVIHQWTGVDITCVAAGGGYRISVPRAFDG